MRVRWDLFVMLLATWNCFSIPFNVAFEPAVMDTWIFVVSNSVIDLLFLLDILVSFRTTFINQKTGDEINDPKLVAKHYVGMSARTHPAASRFWIDFLATVPFDTIAEAIIADEGNTTALQLFGLLKLVRVLRLGRIITYMNLKDDVKMVRRTRWLTCSRSNSASSSSFSSCTSTASAAAGSSS